MTAAPETDTSADTIESGRRLMRAPGLGGLSLGERLTNQLYRWTWRTPLHALRLRGRFPLKLLVVPDDPVAGDAERGRAILSGTIEWRGERIAVADCAFSAHGISPSFSDYLQSFGWLRDLAALGDRAAAAPTAEKLMRQWLAAHAETVSDMPWRGDLWGWRVLNWASHAPLILSSTDLVYRSAVLNTLARGARHLDRVADRTPAGVDRVIAWSGVVAAGLLMPGGEPRVTFGEAGLERALSGAFTGDGGAICRAPLGLIDGIKVLAMLREVFAARRIDAPEGVQATLTMAVPALLGVAMGDGGLGNWQGGGALTGNQVAVAVAASRVRTRPMRHARDWGYQRLTGGQSVVVVDAAPPPVSRVARLGCASTLAFEMSDGAHRLVVNCGGARMGGAMVPPGLAAGLRTTAAHSTLVLSDTNSTAIHSDGSLGKGVSEVEIDRKESEAGSRLEASHDGYARKFGLIHKRTLVLSADGRDLRCDDVLLPASTRQKSGTTPFAIRLHLGRAVEVSPTADGQGALLRIAEGPLWQFRCSGGTLSVDGSVWVDGDGRPHPTQQLVVSGEAPAGGASIGWALRRAG